MRNYHLLQERHDFNRWITHKSLVVPCSFFFSYFTGEFQITKRIPLDDKESNDAYLLNINFPKSKRFLQFESLPLLVDEITNDKPLQPLPLIFFSTNSHLENNSISIPIEYEEGEEEEDDENIITFKKEDPNLMVLTLSDVRGSKYPTLSWTADSEQYEVVNVKDGAYWLRLKELFHTCLERSNYSRNCFDPFLTSPFLLDMMGYVTAPSKVRAQSKFSNFNYQSTSSWSKESKKLITKSSRSQTKKGARQVPKGDNPFLALDDDDDDDDDESDESAEVVSEVINREEIDIDMDDEHDHEQHQQPETPPNLFPMNNRLYENVRAICALDCEMCETSYGSELTRISLICPVDGVILDKLVRQSIPLSPSPEYWI